MSSFKQTVEQTVGSIMLELQLDSGKRSIIRSHLINFLIENRIHVKAVLKVYQLGTLPHSLTIPFPKDYLSYKKVGWVVDGEVKTLSENTNLAKSLAYNQTGLYTGVQTYPSMGNGSSPAVVPQNFQFNTRVGIPELNGFFSEDLDNRLFRLNPNLIMPSFYMEYASDCFDPTDKYIIHPYSYLAAKWSAKYNFLAFAHNIPVHQIQTAMRELDRAERMMRQAFHTKTAIQYLTEYDKAFGYDF